jgi:hypothetical protein
VQTEKRGWVVEVRDRKTNRKLLEQKDMLIRDAHVTPDGHRLLLICKPGMYEGYQVIKIPSGESYWHPPEPVKNVRLYDITSGEERAKFWPGEYKLDDDVWAVAPAPDGKSFYLLTRKHLAQVHFEGAFDIAPWPPAR